jgi:uncharacterized protein (TIGR03066 family)
MRAVLGCAAVFGLAVGLAGGVLGGQDKKDDPKKQDKKKDDPKKPDPKKAEPKKVEPKKEEKVEKVEKVEKLDPRKLVGRWEPADKKAPPMVVEFSADGKVTLAVGEAKAAGTYKLDGDKLEVSMKHGADELKQTLVVKKLTDDELTTEDEKQKTETMRRWKK